jgi:mRNA interferase YafQ
MLPIRPTSRFRRDLKRAGRQGRNLAKLKNVLETLAIPEALPAEYRDHKLKGE